MKRTKLDRTLSELVSIGVQAHLGCQTCLDAHTEAARQIGLSDDDIDAARRATSPDTRIDTLLRFALTVATQLARVADTDIAALRDHGYADREILDARPGSRRPARRRRQSRQRHLRHLMGGSHTSCPAPTLPRPATWCLQVLGWEF